MPTCRLLPFIPPPPHGFLRDTNEGLYMCETRNILSSVSLFFCLLQKWSSSPVWCGSRHEVEGQGCSTVTRDMPCDKSTLDHISCIFLLLHTVSVGNHLFCSFLSSPLLACRIWLKSQIGARSVMQSLRHRPHCTRTYPSNTHSLQTVWKLPDQYILTSFCLDSALLVSTSCYVSLLLMW